MFSHTNVCPSLSAALYYYIRNCLVSTLLATVYLLCMCIYVIIIHIIIMLRHVSCCSVENDADEETDYCLTSSGLLVSS